MRAAITPALLAVALLPLTALAQEPLDSRSSRTDAAPVPDVATASARAEAAPPAPAPVVTREREGARGLSLGGILHTLGGALIGGWVGYVGAQVVKSDWDKENNGSFRDQRSAWVAAGMVAGALGSRVIGTTASPVAEPRRLPERRDGMTITEKEIREASVNNAYELVHSLHREWLIPRGTNSFSETARGEARGWDIRVEPGADKIIVYLDDIRIGGPGEMREIAVDGLTSVEFLGPRRATYRYGSGHAHGAILLSTKVSAR